MSVDTRELENALRRALGEAVDFSAGARALFATDASNYRQAPLGVVTPRTVEEVIAAVRICARHGAPVTPRGGGTALAGQTCNETVLIDFSRWLTEVLEIDPEWRIARVEPGCVLDRLRAQAERSGLTFGPDPATHSHNTLGGMIGNNSCGVHSVQAGRTSENVERLDVLTYDGMRLDVGPTSESELRAIIAAGGRRGEIYAGMRELVMRYGDLIRTRFPRLPRRVSGFDSLDALLPENGFHVARALVGTEATCAIVLGATVRLVESPRARALVLVRFDDVFAAADDVPDVLGLGPMGLEGLDRGLIDRIQKKAMRLEGLEHFSEGGGWLVAEFGGRNKEEAQARAERLVRRYGARAELVIEPGEQQRIWRIRESGLGATAFVPGEPDALPGWEDSAVRPDRLGSYLRALHELMREFGYDAAFYGHFGDGCVHCRIDFDLRTGEGVAHWRQFLERAAELVVSCGGSLSGEHGDGQARAELLEKMYGKELLDCFRTFKRIWDPAGGLNPGKAIDAYRITENLRLGPSYAPRPLATQFAFRGDEGSYSRALERCVGVGKCRRTEPEGEVMCPSYLATREERHSTRGRARLLFEMARGQTITSLWDSEEVEEALRLCLACKGCLSDCPVNVDMASYKAEFRHHHFRGRLRPRTAYSLGLIHLWVRAASLTPAVANAALHAPGIGRIARFAAGMAQDAPAPRFARRSLQSRFRATSASPNARRVVLWPDTFTNYFQPEIGQAALDVLRRAGLDVTIPRRALCCGRALYDWGFLETARRLWRRTIKALAEEIRARTPIIVLEPACYSAFKCELPDLLADDADAKALSEQAVYLADFLRAQNLQVRREAGGGRVLLQPHCHAHALGCVESEVETLERLGFSVDQVGKGCCGMAGAFGLAADTRSVAQAIAERGVLPAVRAAPATMLTVANGFSCREQIARGAGRRVLHLAQVALERLA